MVKQALSFSCSGPRDWLIQRISAVLILVYLIGVALFIANHSPLTYADWHALFACQVMKIMTSMVMFSVLWHAWIGLWTVLTDYVKAKRVRLLLTTLVLISLFYNLVWGLALVWSV